jgi:hypothetical protein
LELRKRDIDKVVAALPPSVRALLETRPLFLAGGFVRDVIAGRKPSDIDLFGPRAELEEAFDHVTWGTAGEVKLAKNTQTWMVKELPVQFVIGFPAYQPETLLDRFNFTVNKAVIWFERHLWGSGEWRSQCSPDFYADLAARKLVPCKGLTNPAISLIKMAKHLGDGWTIDTKDLMLLAAQTASAFVVDVDTEELYAALMTSVDENGYYGCLPRPTIVRAARSNSVQTVSFPELPELENLAYTC